MNRMTIGTHEIFCFVRTAGPVHPDMSLVATEANSIFIAHRSSTLAAEIRYWRALIAPPDTLGMSATGPVAGLTLQLSRCERRAFVATLRMRGLEY
jgi:hypothetical protein